ncbi:sortase, partial [Bacteroides fragilis]|nr:sortase [Bacteroides fragilis]
PVEQASEALLTLTTCHPQFSNAERMIVHAMEVALALNRRLSLSTKV